MRETPAQGSRRDWLGVDGVVPLAVPVVGLEGNGGPLPRRVAHVGGLTSRPSHGAAPYWEPTKPLRPEGTEPERPAELLDATDVLGKRIIDTRLQPRITIGAENAVAAFEVMSRFAIDPRWLIYLPPTMAPTAASARPDILEHPTEAFAAYRRDGITEVIWEEKHMGSRAGAIVCRDADVGSRRFKIDDPAGGTIYTRTGRAFFTDPAWQAKVIDRTRAAISAANRISETPSTPTGWRSTPSCSRGAPRPRSCSAASTQLSVRPATP